MRQATKEVIPPEETVPTGEDTGLRGFIAKFTVLKGAQRELWLTFLIKFLIYTAYSVTNKTMVLWLSKDLGFSDQAAGALVGWVWAPAMTIFTLLAGSITDAIGLRRTFFLGVAICTVARSVMVVTTIPSLALACGVLPLAIGEALGTPVLLGGNAALLDSRAAVDLVLDHLHDNERRLHRCGLDFRLRPSTQFPPQFLRISTNQLSAVVHSQSCFRDRAVSSHLFFAAWRGSNKRRSGD